MLNLPAGLMNEFFTAIGAFFAVFGIFLTLGFAVQIALFILNGIGIHKMSKSLELPFGWLGFVPVISLFQIGKIGQTYVKRDGKPSAKFSIWLLLSGIAMYIIAAVLTFVTIIFVFSVIGYAETAIDSGDAMRIEMFTGIIPLIILCVMLFAVEITYIVLYYVNLWRVFSIFDNKNATLFTVLSILFPFLASIFVFVIRNKQPKVTYIERMGYIPYQTENDTPIL